MDRSLIWFHSEAMDYTLRDKRKVREWLLQLISEEGQQPGPITYIFCDDAYLLEMNQQYLEHDTLTDIITFDYTSSEGVSGDIFISLDRVRENASERGLRVRDELHRVMAHGVLHLLGYKDKSPAEQATMTSKEDYSLSLRDSIGL